MKGHRIVRSRAILRVMMRTGQQSRQWSSQMPLTGWRPAGCSSSPRSSTLKCARLRPVGAQTTCRGFSTEPVFQNSASPEPPSDTIAKPLGETPGGGPAVSSKVKKLTDEILALNMLELSELLKDLKHRLGLTDADLMGPVIGAGTGTGAGAPASAAAEEKPKEKEAFDLKLVGYDEKSKIKVIKEVRTITGLGLKEAKELVEGVPKIVKKELKKEDAEKLVEKLKEVGAKVELV